MDLVSAVEQTDGSFFSSVSLFVTFPMLSRRQFSDIDDMKTFPTPIYLTLIGN